MIAFYDVFSGFGIQTALGHFFQFLVTKPGRLEKTGGPFDFNHFFQFHVSVGF